MDNSLEGVIKGRLQAATGRMHELYAERDKFVNYVKELDIEITKLIGAITELTEILNETIPIPAGTAEHPVNPVE